MEIRVIRLIYECSHSHTLLLCSQKKKTCHTSTNQWTTLEAYSNISWDVWWQSKIPLQHWVFFKKELMCWMRRSHSSLPWKTEHETLQTMMLGTQMLNAAGKEEMKTLMLSQSCNLTPNLQSKNLSFSKNMKYKIGPLQWLTGTKRAEYPSQTSLICAKGMIITLASFKLFWIWNPPNIF